MASGKWPSLLASRNRGLTPDPSPEERGAPSSERLACRAYDPLKLDVETLKIC
jgi:hypothetical protein